MQLQIECNHSTAVNQSCILCQATFQPSQARVIVCNNLGSRFGDLCPTCISQGSDWIWQKLLYTRKNLPKV